MLFFLLFISSGRSQHTNDEDFSIYLFFSCLISTIVFGLIKWKSFKKGEKKEQKIIMKITFVLNFLSFFFFLSFWMRNEYLFNERMIEREREGERVFFIIKLKQTPDSNNKPRLNWSINVEEKVTGLL